MTLQNGPDGRPLPGIIPRGDEMIKLANDRGIMIWDRWEVESDRAWMGFQYYRDMGPGRTIKAVREDFQFDDGTVTGWVSKFRWRDRAEAWDRHLDRIRQRAYEEESASMGRRHAQMGMKLQALGEERIKEYSEREELKGQITVREAIDLTRVGVEIEREARASDSKSKEGEGGTLVFVFNQAQPKWIKGKSETEDEKLPQMNVIDAEIVNEGPNAKSDGGSSR